MNTEVNIPKPKYISPVSAKFASYIFKTHLDNKHLKVLRTLSFNNNNNSIAAYFDMESFLKNRENVRMHERGGIIIADQRGIPVEHKMWVELRLENTWSKVTVLTELGVNLSNLLKPKFYNNYLSYTPEQKLNINIDNVELKKIYKRIERYKSNIPSLLTGYNNVWFKYDPKEQGWIKNISEMEFDSGNLIESNLYYTRNNKTVHVYRVTQLGDHIFSVY